MAESERRVVGVDDTEEIEVTVGGTWRTVGEDQPDSFAKISGGELSGLNPAMRQRLSRSLRKGHSGSNGAGSKKEELNEVSGYNLFDLVQPPYNLDYLARLMTVSEAHQAAVHAKTSNIVGLGYDFINSHKTRNKLDAASSIEKTSKIRRGLQNMKDQLFTKIDECNTEDDFLETLRKVYIDYEATGNGYFEIGRGAQGEIAYIGHIPATTMRVRKQRDGFVQVISNKAVFFRNFGEDTPNPIGSDQNPNEVIHIKKYNPINSFYGVPDIIPALTSIVGNKFAAQFNVDYFENKAVPRYVIVIKGGKLADGAQKKIVDFFEANLKGAGGNHRTLFIPLPADDSDRKSSFEMKPVEAGTQDASFINYNKVNLNNILMAHRVPITKVSMADGTALSAARDADKTFKEQVCRPEQRILEKKLGKVFREFTDAFDFKLNELTLTDEDTQSQIDERYLRMKVILPNEVRARWGWSEIEGGDKPVELKPQVAAEQRAQAGATRTRDAERSAKAPDKQGEARNPKGAGRQVS